MVGVYEASDDGQGEQLEAIPGSDAHPHIGDMTNNGVLADAQALSSLRTSKTNGQQAEYFQLPPSDTSGFLLLFWQHLPDTYLPHTRARYLVRTPVLAAVPNW
jgi:hypothetical protein